MKQCKRLSEFHCLGDCLRPYNDLRDCRTVPDLAVIPSGQINDFVQVTIQEKCLNVEIVLNCKCEYGAYCGQKGDWTEGVMKAVAQKE